MGKYWSPWATAGRVRRFTPKVEKADKKKKPKGRAKKRNQFNKLFNGNPSNCNNNKYHNKENSKKDSILKMSHLSKKKQTPYYVPKGSRLLELYLPNLNSLRNRQKKYLKKKLRYYPPFRSTLSEEACGCLGVNGKSSFKKERLKLRKMKILSILCDNDYNHFSEVETWSF